MGFVSSETIRPGGDHLLSLLAREGAVPYSRFYGEDVDIEALAAETGLDADHAHVLIEFAAGQLERAGIVACTPLPARLLDGEGDYSIVLTDRGRAFLAERRRFRYRDMDL